MFSEEALIERMDRELLTKLVCQSDIYTGEFTETSLNITKELVNNTLKWYGYIYAVKGEND